MLMTRKQRAYPNLGQEETLLGWDATLRCLHNAALQERKDNLRFFRRWGFSDFISYQDQAEQLTAIRRELDWVRAVPAQVTQQMLMDLDAACRKHGARRVKYWARDRHAPSFRYPTPKYTPVERLNRKWGRVFLPKLGWLRFKWTQAMTGSLRRLTVIRDGNQWHVAFLYDTGADAPEPKVWTPSEAAGCDVGVANSLVVVDQTGQGVAFDRAFISPGETQRLLRLQRRQAKRRRVNKQWRTSKRYQHTQAQIRDLYARQRRRRRDFHDQTAALLTSTYPFVAHEDLNITGMTKSAKGTAAAPGTNVAQKRSLNRAILNKGWGIFFRLLQWHAVKRGTHSHPTPAHHTSQQCPRCLHVTRENRESQAVFTCQTCKFTTHADVVGAWNTRERGVVLASTPGHPHPGADSTGSVGRQAASGTPPDDDTQHKLGVGGDSALAGSVKRQPLKSHAYLVSV